MISAHVGIRMDVEVRYKWIVFLPNKGTGIGALNRYYGLFNNGNLKVRGIELRQHNTPEFLKNIQSDILKVFSQADNTQDFLKLIPTAINIMLYYGNQLIKGFIDPYTLVFTTRVSRNIPSYKVNNLVKSALLQLQDNDINVEPGQSVSYIVTKEYSNDFKKRVCAMELLTGTEKIDVDFYLHQIAKCCESILIPFGYTIENLEGMLKKFRYRVKLVH